MADSSSLQAELKVLGDADVRQLDAKLTQLVQARDVMSQKEWDEMALFQSIRLLP